MIYHLDADMNGLDSIQDRIVSGKVTRLPCPSIQAFDRNCVALINNVGPDDTVVLDTIGSMLDTIRGDFKLGDESADLLANVNSKYLSGDKNYLVVFEAAAQVVMRRIKNLRARDCHIIVTAHEDEVRDDTTLPAIKRFGPAVNPAMIGRLVGAASDVFRLYQQLGDLVNPENPVEVTVPDGTRLLRLRKTVNEIAKFHVTPDRSDAIAQLMREPTMPKLCAHLGKRPSFLVVYGGPGVGKTTFATSDAA